jgi:hypothetical protein
MRQAPKHADWNIFGGFTPLESGLFGGDKADPSLKSFLFALKNPHNVPASRFALRERVKHEAISCDVSYGPFFCEFSVSDNCNENTNSSAREVGDTYTNDTRLDRETFFTEWENFQVKEIEVFEMAFFHCCVRIAMTIEEPEHRKTAEPPVLEPENVFPEG